ncbi:TPA: hypothetical protein SAO52_000169 [Burkholderia vietnamiensis]|nr:hypothetical protein [Burkholderia vietnamiensis]
MTTENSRADALTADERDVIDSALLLAETSGSHAFVLPVPNTTPALYVALGEAEQLEKIVKTILSTSPASQPAAAPIDEPLWDSKGNVIHAAVDRLGEARAAAPSPADERAFPATDGYFVYGRAGGYVEFYDTDAERDAAHREAIAEYRRDAIHDQEWPTEVEGIVSGVVTHTTAELKVHEDSFEFEPRAVASQARASSATETGAEGANALAHEVWSAAQRAPGEGIEDAVQRIAAILSRSHTAAAEAVAIPAGYALVPIEPTPEMLDCWWDGLPKGTAFLNCTPRGIYAAMLAAATQPAQADVRVGLTATQLATIRLGLRAAKSFIANGIELGFVRMPDADCPDPAHNTPKLIDDALALLAAHPGQPEPRAEVTKEQPSLTNPLTPYGMLCRALRIVTGTLLGDMSKSLQMSSAKLSAMEFGREPVTPEIVREVGKYFERLGVGNMRPALQHAANAARTGASS